MAQETENKGWHEKKPRNYGESVDAELVLFVEGGRYSIKPVSDLWDRETPPIDGNCVLRFFHVDEQEVYTRYFWNFDEIPGMAAATAMLAAEKHNREREAAND